DRLVLVHAGADGRADLPRRAVVVGVHGHGLHRARGVDDRVLLEEAARVLAVLELDALAGGREARARPEVTGDLGRDRAVRPRAAVVRRAGDVRLDDVARGRVRARLRPPEALVVGLHVEVEDRPRLAVDDVARVGVALDRRGRPATRDDLLRPPGDAVVVGAALQDRVRAGRVGARGAAVVGREDGAAVGHGEGRDAVVGEAALPVRRELLLAVGAPSAGRRGDVVVGGGGRVVR